MPVHGYGDPLGASRSAPVLRPIPSRSGSDGKPAPAGAEKVLHAASPVAAAEAQAAADLASTRAQGRGLRTADALMQMLTGGDASDAAHSMVNLPQPRPGVPSPLNMTDLNLREGKPGGGATLSFVVRRRGDSRPHQLKLPIGTGTSLKDIGGWLKAKGASPKVVAAFIKAVFQNWVRKTKAGGLDSENLGEMIAACVAQSVSKTLSRQDAKAQAVISSAPVPDWTPEVSLVYDEETGRTSVASRYLLSEGSLDEVFGGATGAHGHICVELARDQETTPANRGHWRPTPDQARQVCDILALSALLGDHDVNPGNLLQLEGGSIGRIDFGHAFNDLITGKGGDLTGGGGVRDLSSNRIRDYFNRTTVSHALPSHRIPKVWRDYKGFVPSEMLGDALLAVASRRVAASEGLAEAGARMLALTSQLNGSTRPKDQTELQHLAQSMEAIARKTPLAGKQGGYHPPPADSHAHNKISAAFAHLHEFVQEGHDQMVKVGVACKLQGMIKARLETGTKVDWKKLESDGLALLKTHELPPYEALPWLRFSLDEKPFDGSFMAYIDAQRKMDAQPKSAL